METTKIDVKILYIEDEADTREMVTGLLQRRISNVYVATNGQEGLQLFEQYKPDIVITDLRMPVMDGLIVARAIREKDPLIQIIMTTAYSDTDYLLDAIDIGVNQYVLKPINLTKLFSAIGHCNDMVFLKRKNQDHNHELELWVSQRTMELMNANEQLRIEVVERRQAEQAALYALEQNQQLLASISSIVVGVSEEGLVMEWNPAAEKIFGLTSAEVIGKLFAKCPIHWNWPDVIEPISFYLTKKGQYKLDNLHYTRTDGKEGLLEFSVNRIGEGKAYYLFGTDITDRKSLENQNLIVQKMHSLSQLAAEIAHEINRPTQHVEDNIHFLQNAYQDIVGLLSLYSQLLLENKKHSLSAELTLEIEEITEEIHLESLLVEIPKAIGQILHGKERLIKIVRTMEDFAHPSQSEKKFVNINKALEETFAVLKVEWEDIAGFELDLDPKLPAVYCAIDEINQVIFDILANVTDANKEVIKDETGQKEKITVKTKRADEFINIIIEDTGSGIPPEMIDKIFDPFFTTKEPGKGKGQGLAIAHNIIAIKHHGKLEVQSEIGKGSTFTISLPLDIDN